MTIQNLEYKTIAELVYRHSDTWRTDRWGADQMVRGTDGDVRGTYRMIDLDRSVNLYQGETTSTNKSSSCRKRVQSHRLSFVYNNRSETTGLKIRQYMKDNDLSEMRVRYEYADMTGYSDQDIIKAQDNAILSDKPLFNVRGAA